MRYCAAIKAGGYGYRWLGTYATPEDAARAYNRIAQEVYGEFAWLNEVPDQGDESEWYAGGNSSVEGKRTSLHDLGLDEDE